MLRICLLDRDGCLQWFLNATPFFEIEGQPHRRSPPSIGIRYSGESISVSVRAKIASRASHRPSFRVPFVSPSWEQPLYFFQLKREGSRGPICGVLTCPFRRLAILSLGTANG